MKPVTRVTCIVLLSTLAGCQNLSSRLPDYGMTFTCVETEQVCNSEVEEIGRVQLRLDNSPKSLAAWVDYQGKTLDLEEEARAAIVDQSPQGEVEQLQHVLLLSHPDAGYRERLRAQLRLETKLDSLPPRLQHLFRTVYSYNQRLLENASVLALSERNATQQQATIKELRAKLEALTQIEDELRNSNQETTP